MTRTAPLTRIALSTFGRRPNPGSSFPMAVTIAAHAIYRETQARVLPDLLRFISPARPVRNADRHRTCAPVAGRFEAWPRFASPRIAMPNPEAERFMRERSARHQTVETSGIRLALLEIARYSTRRKLTRISPDRGTARHTRLAWRALSKKLACVSTPLRVRLRCIGTVYATAAVDCRPAW